MLWLLQNGRHFHLKLGSDVKTDDATHTARDCEKVYYLMSGRKHFSPTLLDSGRGTVN